MSERKVAKKKKNIMGLKLKLPAAADGASGGPGSLSPPMTNEHINANIKEKLKNQNLCESQRRFFFQKSKVLQDHQLSKEDFDVLGVLGFGSGGCVQKIKHKHTGVVMAQKLIHLEIKPETSERISRELKILHECDSPDIVGFFGSFVEGSEINVLMEYMDAGSLDKVLERVGRIEEFIVGTITSKVINGLVYLFQEQKVIHRDVKPSNILVNTQGDIKLCDFGVSGELQNSLELANTFVGTRSYMAPERILGKHYKVESDVWSLGMSVLELATGNFPIPVVDPPPPIIPIRPPRSPLEAKEPPKKPPMAIFDLICHIVEGDAPKPPKDGFTSEFQDFVTACLQKDIEKRPLLEKLSEHPWIKLSVEENVNLAAWAQSTMPSPENVEASKKAYTESISHVV